MNLPNNQPVRKANTANLSDCREGELRREQRNRFRTPRDIANLLPTNHVGKKKIQSTGTLRSALHIPHTDNK